MRAGPEPPHEKLNLVTVRRFLEEECLQLRDMQHAINEIMTKYLQKLRKQSEYSQKAWPKMLTSKPSSTGSVADQMLLGSFPAPDPVSFYNT